MTEMEHSGDALWERIERAVENVKDRMRRVTETLENAGVAYAIVDGNAVQMWVAQVDESVVRNTRDVDIALNREDLPAAIAALQAAGFIFRQAAGVTMFLDGPGVAISVADADRGSRWIVGRNADLQPIGCAGQPIFT